MAERRDYEGRRVVVTGCASGIGEALSRILVDRGAEVIGVDRAPCSLPLAAFHTVDLADPNSIAAGAEAIGEPVDALFNVAGISGTAAPALVVSINFAGTRALTEELLPRMRAGSAIVITSSLAASRYAERRELINSLLATSGHAEVQTWCRAHVEEVGTGYAISKDALIWYTLDHALPLAGRGIRINAIAPGITETPIIADTRRSRGDAFLEAIPLPMGRLARPEEQAAVMAFLGSDEAGYLSGQVMWVDGGYSAAVQAGALENVTGSVGVAPSAADGGAAR